MPRGSDPPTWADIAIWLEAGLLGTLIVASFALSWL